MFVLFGSPEVLLNRSNDVLSFLLSSALLKRSSFQSSIHPLGDLSYGRLPSTVLNKTVIFSSVFERRRELN